MPKCKSNRFFRNYKQWVTVEFKTVRRINQKVKLIIAEDCVCNITAPVEKFISNPKILPRLHSKAKGNMTNFGAAVLCFLEQRHKAARILP